MFDAFNSVPINNFTKHHRQNVIGEWIRNAQLLYRLPFSWVINFPYFSTLEALVEGESLLAIFVASGGKNKFSNVKIKCDVKNINFNKFYDRLSRKLSGMPKH